MKKASIISVGNELLAGLIVNTNAAFLSRELLSMGIPTIACYTVGDQIDSIIQTLSQAAQQADIILITGGLGPTDDDLTRQALAEFMQVELEFRAELLSRISEFFTMRDLKMSEKNRIQAYIPSGAEAIANNVGTSPGIIAERDGKIFVCLPGVPEEMKQMFSESVATKVQQAGGGQVVIMRKLNCFGTGESVIAEKLGDLMQRDRNPLINCTVSGGIITLHIVATAADRAVAEGMIEKDARQLTELLGDLVYGRNDETMAEVVGAKLREQAKKLAVAESCTGGLIGKLITDVPGSSDYFECGWVTYSDETKVRQLGVDAGLIERYGAVSAEVARAMARGAREKANSDFAIGVTGIAGPGGGTEQKPVGLVYIAVEGSRQSDVQSFIFSHSRGHIRYRTALAALNILRLKL